jgi:NAD(P)-dependent dehydrogenase (short-subunit alcohol dehydrogenase family)
LKQVGEVRERCGPATVLFNNAAASGVVPGKPGLELSDDDWRACLDVNLLAPFRLAQAFVPDMVEQGEGSIVNVLSTAGFTPVPGTAAWAYGATKAGLEMLTRYLAKECGPAMRATCLCPGTIAPEGEMREVWKPLLAGIPLGRIGRASETAAAALFLASRASSYVTGQTIFVDGGRVNTVA